MLDTENFAHKTDVDLRELKLLSNVKDELTVCTRIVVPKTLRADAIRLAHVGHQGIVKTKSLMREKILFSLIDSLVKAEIDACIPCKPQDVQKLRNLCKCVKFPKKTLILSALTF